MNKQQAAIHQFTTKQLGKNETESVRILPRQPKLYIHVSLLHDDLHSSVFPLTEIFTSYS